MIGDLWVFFNSMGAFLSYYVVFWHYNPHAHMVMELY